MKLTDRLRNRLLDYMHESDTSLYAIHKDLEDQISYDGLRAFKNSATEGNGHTINMLDEYLTDRGYWHDQLRKEIYIYRIYRRTCSLAPHYNDNFSSRALMKFKKILDQVEPIDNKQIKFLIQALILAKMRSKKMFSCINLSLIQKDWLDDNGFKHSYNKNLGEHEILIEEYPW